MGHFILRFFFSFKLISKQNTVDPVSGEWEGDTERDGEGDTDSDRGRKRSNINFCWVLRKQESPDHATA